MQVVTKLVFVRSLSKILNHRGYSMYTHIVDKVCTHFDGPVSDLLEHVADLP